MSWIGNGINYGHQATNNPYDLAAVAADFYLFQRLGITKLRVAYTSYDATNIAAVQAVVQLALSMGFYVVWGVSAGGATVTATRWAAFKSYVVNTIAPWAQAQNSANLQLSVGNEEELHVDGTTVTAATVRSDINGTYTAAVKAVYTKGSVSYETAATQQNAWAALGRGNLDIIGFNVYYETDPQGNFKTSVNAISSNFGAAGYISEWSTANGFSDLGTEYGWAANLVQRQALIPNGMDAYCFAARDGGFGLSANTFALIKSDGTSRLALAALSRQAILKFG